MRTGGKSKEQAGRMLTQGYTIPGRVGTEDTVKTYAPIDAALAAAGIELATKGKISAKLRHEQDIDVEGLLPVQDPEDDTGPAEKPSG